MRAGRRIAQNRVDEIADGIIIALDVDLNRAGRYVTHRPRDRESRCKPYDSITEADALHATVQLEDDAPYAFTSARAPFAARSNIPLSPE